MLKFLRDNYLFSGVSEKSLALLINYVTENTYSDGETIFNEGETGDLLHIITKGLIKVVKYSKEGKTKTLAILKQHDSFGEMALLTKEARSATVAALEETNTLSISKNNLIFLLSKEPSISIQIIKTLAERLAKADRDIKILALGDAKTRIACVLFDFKDEIEIVKFTHQEIGDLAGLTRETTTRTLKQMEDDKILKVENRKIHLLDLKKLKGLTL
jgi:CRP-like cAMP-binding protein